MTGPGEPYFPFYDVVARKGWVVRPNRGMIPWWLFSGDRKVPGAKLREFLPLATLHWAKPHVTVAEAFAGGGELYRTLVEPLAIAALNTMPDKGSARLLGRVVQESLAAGGDACVPCFPAVGLSETLIDPALARLAVQKAEISFGRRVAAIDVVDQRVRRLVFADGESVLEAGDAVVLAVPAPVAAQLISHSLAGGLVVPDAFEAIINLHYKIDVVPTKAGFVGVIGGIGEWIFIKPGHVSVTISAGNRHLDLANEQLAAIVWREIQTVLGLAADMPLWRIVREKRATFEATEAQEQRRPGTDIGIQNLALAGDWTATGLPATIEGAIRSGRAAAKHLLR